MNDYYAWLKRMKRQKICITFVPVKFGKWRESLGRDDPITEQELSSANVKPVPERFIALRNKRKPKKVKGIPKRQNKASQNQRETP